MNKENYLSINKKLYCILTSFWNVTSRKYRFYIRFRSCILYNNEVFILISLAHVKSFIYLYDR